MTDITELDQQTVERIAAGEVVERPASVVKELVENSIDADASRVEVTVESGGKDGITVSDDGVGMTEADARAAVREHTTSKISDIDDLEAGVGTLGFRGEALHAISAVSRLTLTTCPRDDNGEATELRVEGGEVTDVSPAARAPGTTVEVTDLFYNVPARRKYLKQDSTEFAHVNTVVSGYALANPDVAVSLTHDGRELFATDGQGDLRSAVMAVYGREVATSMIPVEMDDEALPDGPLSGVRGLVSHPETTRATRDYLSTYVNGRYVRATAPREAAVDAYGTQLAGDRYPFAVLFLDLPAGEVDVNVHPRKLEVRFADEAGVRDQVRTAVREALLEEGLVRSSAPRGRSAPDETEITPGGTGDEREHGRDDDVDRSVESSAGESAGAATDDAPTSVSETEGTVGTDEGTTSAGADRKGVSERAPATTPETNTPSSTDSPSEARADRSADEVDVNDEEGAAGTLDADQEKFTAPLEQRTLSGESADRQREFASLPRMRVLGQVHDTYVVAETEDGLVLVDQHAADERVNYERLREQFRDDVTTQALAEPIDLELTGKEAALFDAHVEALAQLGFHASREGRTLRVTTVPALLAGEDPGLVRDLLTEFVDGDPGETVEATADELLGDMACYPSITGNTSLTEGSVVDLLTALDDCENPYACPHGRPVLIELSESEIEDRFERDYPGHV